MKIILYKRGDSFLSKLVSVVTGSQYTHSAILISHEGKCYFSDASLTDGIVVTQLRNLPEYLKDRDFDIYQLNGITDVLNNDAFAKILKLVGEPYDLTGTTLWLWYRLLKSIGFYKQNNKYYCFEYTLEVLSSYYTIDKKLFIAPSGDTIHNLMKQLASPTRFLNCNKVG